jgi:hypothetical protein
MYKRIRAIVMAVTCVVAVMSSQQASQAATAVQPTPKIVYMDALAGSPDPQLYVYGYADARTMGDFYVANTTTQFSGSAVKVQFFAADAKGATHATIWLSGYTFNDVKILGSATARIDVTKYANGSYSLSASINPGTSLSVAAAKEMPWSGGSLVMK